MQIIVYGLKGIEVIYNLKKNKMINKIERQAFFFDGRVQEVEEKYKTNIEMKGTIEALNLELTSIKGRGYKLKEKN